MAYNIFKRPMFKRGGATTGTGIMSHVEPRVKAANGFMGMNFGISQSPSQAQLDAFRQAEANRLQRRGSAGFNILGPRFTDPNYQSPFSEFFSTNTGFGFLKPGVRTGDGTGITANIQNNETGLSIPDRNRGQGQTQTIEKVVADQQEDKVGKEDIKYEESDIKNDIENEIELLQETLGPSISNAEKAFLIAKAAGTPGGISAKLDVAREEGLKLSRQKAKDDRAIKLAAYKSAKDIEKARIAAGKLGETERLYDQYAKLKVKTNRSEEEEAKFQALRNKLEKTGELENLQRAYAAKAYDANRIRSLEEKIRTLEAKSSRSDLEEKTLDKQKAELKEQYLYKSILGFENGGRVMKQMGGPMTEDTIVSTETVTQDQVEPSKTVQTLSYAELRDRLPKEITDDIVQLIAASEKALQDFAYIRTQQDVNDFNVKYGVNLVLPASAT